MQLALPYNEPDDLACNPTSRHGTGNTFTWPRPTVEPVCLLCMYIRSKSKKITEKKSGNNATFLDLKRCVDVSWWRHQMETFSALLALCEGVHWSPVDSPYKGQWRGALMSSVICAWTNGSASNDRDPGDLRRHHAHYDVTVMWWIEVQVAAWNVLRMRTETGGWWCKRNNFGEYRFQADKTKSLRLNRNPHNGPLLFIH